MKRLLALAAVVLGVALLGTAVAFDFDFTGKRWTIYAEIYGKQEQRGKSSAQLMTDASEQCSEKGEEASSFQSNQKDEDGSTRDIDTASLLDARGNAAVIRRTVDVDPAGNRRDHIEEETTDRNGNRETTTVDREYDPNGKKTKDEQRSSKSQGKRPLDQARWSGTITVSNKMSFSEQKPVGTFGIGRNQEGTSTTRTTQEDTIQVTLQRASAAAMIRRAVTTSDIKEVDTKQEIKCIGKWTPWEHHYSDRFSSNTRGVELRPVSVSIAADGTYVISFEAPGTSGSSTHTIIDSISEPPAIPGPKTTGCWGRGKPTVSYAGPIRESPLNISLSGTIDPKHPDTLSGSSNSPGLITRSATWNLNRVPRCSPSYRP